MKNKIKLQTVLGIVCIIFIAALALTSCGEKGGEIIVTNEYKLASVGTPVQVIIFKGVEFSVEKVKTEGEWIPYNQTKTYTFDENNTYTVVAVPPFPFFTEVVVLLGGNSKKVTIK